MNDFYCQFALQWTAVYLFVDIGEQPRKISELIKAAFNIMLIAEDIKRRHLSKGSCDVKGSMSILSREEKPNASKCSDS